MIRMHSESEVMRTSTLNVIIVTSQTQFAKGKNVLKLGCWVAVDQRNINVIKKAVRKSNPVKKYLRSNDLRISEEKSVTSHSFLKIPTGQRSFRFKEKHSDKKNHTYPNKELEKYWEEAAMKSYLLSSLPEF